MNPKFHWQNSTERHGCTPLTWPRYVLGDECWHVGGLQVQGIFLASARGSTFKNMAGVPKKISKKISKMSHEKKKHLLDHEIYWFGL